MKATMSCAALAVAMTGCMGMLMGSQSVTHKVPVQVEGGQVAARKSLGSVGADVAKNAGVRVRSPSISVLQTWERWVELTRYSPDRACFRLVDYQGTGDVYGDGEVLAQNYADYNGAKVMLDTASGAHYEATPSVATEALTFQYDSYVTEGADEGLPPRWVPAVAHWNKYDVEVCFDTAAPLAGETNVRWTIKNQRWDLSFDFGFGGVKNVAAGGAKRKLDAVAPPPAPAPAAVAPPPRPETFVGRWSGDVAMTMVVGKDTSGGRAQLTIAIEEVTANQISLTFEGAQFTCSFRAKVSGRRAAIHRGQVCKVPDSKRKLTFRTTATDLTLTDTGLALSFAVESTSRKRGETEKGSITLTGELAAL